MNPLGHPPTLKVRKGYAKLLVFATIQEEGPEGDNWDPEELRRETLTAFDQDADPGGHEFKVPDFGASFAYATTFATNPDNAEAVWQQGEDGLVQINVQSHGEASENLARVSSSVVDVFDP